MKKSFIAIVIFTSFLSAGWPCDANAGWVQSVKEMIGIKPPSSADFSQKGTLQPPSKDIGIIPLQGVHLPYNAVCPVQLFRTGLFAIAQTPSGNIYWWGEKSSSNTEHGGFEPRLIPELAGLHLCSTPGYATKADGSVVTFNIPFYQPWKQVIVTPVPELTNVADIQGMAGIGAQVFLTKDGTVGIRKCVYYDATSCNHVVINDLLTDVKMISAGYGDFVLALKNDGTVWARGSNYRGVLGNGQSEDNAFVVHDFAMIDALKSFKIVAIATGNGHGMALTQDGEVYAWGDNSLGQLGVGSFDNFAIPTKVKFPGVVMAYGGPPKIAYIAAGDATSLAIGENGSLWMWGDNRAGQLGIGSTFNQPQLARVNALTKVMAAATASGRSIAVLPSGEPCRWGSIMLGVFSDDPKMRLELPQCGWQPASNVNLCE